MSIKIGITTEETNFPVSLTCLTPKHCADLQSKLDIEFVIQPCNTRCYSDKEYADLGLTLNPNLADCDVMLNVYKTTMANITPGSKLFRFAYTQNMHANNQPLYNICELKGSTLVDIDLLHNHQNKSVISISNVAGKIGMHNALVALGKKTQSFDLPLLENLASYEDAHKLYKNISLPIIKIIIVGTGQESLGAIQVLEDLNIKRITPELFVLRAFPEPVFTHINEYYCAKRTDGLPFTMNEFYDHPEEFESDFSHFITTSDMLINGYARRKKAPILFGEEVTKNEDFRIKIIADVNAVTSENSAIPCVKKINDLDQAFYGYDPSTGNITEPFLPDTIDIMAAHHLPLALAKDTSIQIGDQITEHLIPELLMKKSRMIEKATIIENGDWKNSTDGISSL